MTAGSAASQPPHHQGGPTADGVLENPWKRSQYLTLQYATTDPDVEDKATANVGLLLVAWAVPESTAETIISCTRALIADAVETHAGDRIAVATVLADGQVSVNVVSVSCTQPHTDLIDPDSARVLHSVANQWGAGEPSTRCLCTDLALVAEDWKPGRMFIARPTNPRPFSPGP
ncbi:MULTISPECIES: hypothetical protein [unclassified Streptomyces]|uniref:hypothetical protein n=1 Tax=unclassified Streptomyces TaxID=2593676 RepID=UPI002366F1E9|nr:MULTISPECIES: hypothetical protein [unclassified Streptomyces]MDF3141084.1 hypothetical protein [Streptomyces sp. T21Q-yed]WDF45069.1 hypothetical protein PBV52_51125 [Streptomyces sp. T12]